MSRIRAATHIAALVLIAIASSIASSVRAQDTTASKEVMERRQQEMLSKVVWQKGPVKASLGSRGEINVPANYQFADPDNARTFLEALGNPSDGNELGVVMPLPSTIKNDADFFFIVFTFQDVGYVKDDDKSELLTDDAANAILNSIKTATDNANELRRQRGWPTVNIGGWDTKPFYDPVTNNLTWAIQILEQDSAGVNYDSRILGREGVIAAKMVVSQGSLAALVPTYRNMVQHVSFKQGQRYSEFRSGDKVATYGLIGLAAGGATVAIAKAWKGLVKLIVVGIGALFAAIGSLFRKIKSFFTGGNKQTTNSTSA
jgi:uncharacterized membrane-anchored protein